MTMPERGWNAVTIIEGERLVPEQRALDAESEMATWKTIAQGNGDRARMGDDMLEEERARVAALTAERDALVPLARLGDLLLQRLQRKPFITTTHEDMKLALESGVCRVADEDTIAANEEQVIAARAILGRVP